MKGPRRKGWSIPASQSPESAKPPREQAIPAVAERQHGVIALSQLEALGFSQRAVRSRVAAKTLHRVHRGVYAVGHPLLTAEGRWMAAVLSCGPGAVLSHRSAGAHLGLRASERARVDVTTVGRAGRSRPGIDAHSGATLERADVTTVDRIPCTTVPRTLLDLAEVVSRRALERALDQAEVMGLFHTRALKELLARAGGRRGAGALRAILAGHAIGETLTRRELEERFITLCDRAGLPRPMVNDWVVLWDGEALQVDFLWRPQRLIVETDGWGSHRTRRAFEEDRARDQKLTLAGYRVVRFTWRQVRDEPGGVAATVRALLG